MEYTDQYTMSPSAEIVGKTLASKETLDTLAETILHCSVQIRELDTAIADEEVLKNRAAKILQMHEENIAEKADIKNRLAEHMSSTKHDMAKEMSKLRSANIVAKAVEIIQLENGKPDSHLVQKLVDNFLASKFIDRNDIRTAHNLIEHGAALTEIELHVPGLSYLSEVVAYMVGTGLTTEKPRFTHEPILQMFFETDGISMGSGVLRGFDIVSRESQAEQLNAQIDTIPPNNCLFAVQTDSENLSHVVIDSNAVYIDYEGAVEVAEMLLDINPDKKDVVLAGTQAIQALVDVLQLASEEDGSHKNRATNIIKAIAYNLRNHGYLVGHDGRDLRLPANHIHNVNVDAITSSVDKAHQFITHKKELYAATDMHGNDSLIIRPKRTLQHPIKGTPQVSLEIEQMLLAPLYQMPGFKEIYMPNGGNERDLLKNYVIPSLHYLFNLLHNSECRDELEARRVGNILSYIAGRIDSLSERVRHINDGTTTTTETESSSGTNHDVAEDKTEEADEIVVDATIPGTYSFKV